MHATLEEAIEDMRERVEALEEAGLERQMRRPSAKQRKEYEDRKQRLEDRKRRLRTRLAKLEAVLDRLQEEPRRHNAGSLVSENETAFGNSVNAGNPPTSEESPM